MLVVLLLLLPPLRQEKVIKK